MLCLTCNKVITNSNLKYCDMICYSKSPYRKKTVFKKCVFCQKSFIPLRGRIATQMYCSRQCSYKDRKRLVKERGYYYSVKRSLSKEATRKRLETIKNKTDEEKEITHQRLCAAARRNSRFGSANNWWKNDASKKYSENWQARRSAEFKEWREKVYSRDNYTCQKYGTIGGKINPHHIKNFAQYPELRFVVSNGITLSQKAHREFHRIYGIKNNNMKQLLEYISY